MFVVDNFGNKKWYNDKDQLHRVGGPAIEDADGSVMYFMNGVLNNSEGPAVVLQDGSVKYYINGLLHNDDGPAVITPDGVERFYRSGILHNDDGYAVIIPGVLLESYFEGVLHSKVRPSRVMVKDGKKVWYVNGEIGRLDGPAVITSKSEKWVTSGVEHRIGGPSFEAINGDYRWMIGGILHNAQGPAVRLGEIVSYYLNGILYKKAKWLSEISQSDRVLALSNPLVFL